MLLACIVLKDIAGSLAYNKCSSYMLLACIVLKDLTGSLAYNICSSVYCMLLACIIDRL